MISYPSEKNPFESTQERLERASTGYTSSSILCSENTFFLVVDWLWREDTVEKCKGSTLALISSKSQGKEYLKYHTKEENKLERINTRTNEKNKKNEGNTDIFDENQNRHAPDNGGDTANDILLTGNWARSWPDTIEHVKGRSSCSR
jgi:hypothetical protein